MYFADTHSVDPPRLRVEVDDSSQEYQTPPGGGDASVFGDPVQGPAVRDSSGRAGRRLKAGTNRIAITTLTGSWVLWDAVRFVAPAGVKLAEVQDFISAVASGSKNVLGWHDGKAVQPVAVRIFHAGPAGRGELRVGDLEAAKVQLRPACRPWKPSCRPWRRAKCCP